MPKHQPLRFRKRAPIVEDFAAIFAQALKLRPEMTKERRDRLWEIESQFLADNRRDLDLLPPSALYEELTGVRVVSKDVQRWVLGADGCRNARLAAIKENGTWWTTEQLMLSFLAQRGPNSLNRALSRARSNREAGGRS